MEVGKKMVFEETELRLGLPGNGRTEGEVARKRGFSETVGLKLNLFSKEETIDPAEKFKGLHGEKNLLAADPTKTPAK